MNLIYSKLKNQYHHFNTRSHSYDDFEYLAKCEKVKVNLVEYPPEIKGYFCIRKQRRYTEKFIVINKKLSLFERQFVAFHELAHCLLHVPMIEREYFYCSLHKKTNARQDAEADAVALIMMIPKWLLFELSDTPFEELHPFTQEILIKRRKIFEDFGY